MNDDPLLRVTIMLDMFAGRGDAVIQRMWARAQVLASGESEEDMTTTTRATLWTAALIGARILAKIVSHIGQKEIPPGSNSGPDVDTKLQYVGVPLSLPKEQKAWCAAEASFDTGHVLTDIGLADIPHCCTASSHEAVNWAIQHNTRQTALSAVPGDWCIERGGDGDKAADGYPYHHTTVIEYIAGNVVHWVAGNTGDAVARGKCLITECCLMRAFVLPTGG